MKKGAQSGEAFRRSLGVDLKSEPDRLGGLSDAIREFGESHRRETSKTSGTGRDARTTERVRFRLMVMPCCGYHVCWVNPRLPTYCPECGVMVLPRLRTQGDLVLISDEEASLTYHPNR